MHIQIHRLMDVPARLAASFRRSRFCSRSREGELLRFDQKAEPLRRRWPETFCRSSASASNDGFGADVVAAFA